MDDRVLEELSRHLSESEEHLEIVHSQTQPLMERPSLEEDDERASILAHSSDDDILEEETKYFFAGKLTMFPLTVIFLIVGVVALLRYGRKTYRSGYFTSNEFYVGLVGVFLFILTVMFGIVFLRYTVIRIHFFFTRDHFVIVKKGVFKKTKMVSLYLGKDQGPNGQGSLSFFFT
eukprot:TRINITY_DN15857_c0_g1_i1.p1 TRINITY_DN15857_c0_g1~~TRINITY_DN15857_c0_g1_i1.p1  ORF type:complete len:199 (-),score=44.48 TRINITY_DN15857_c0_g1_i1:559-1083(-)